MEPDGTKHVTTPSGIIRTTRPDGLRPPSPPEQPPPEPPRSSPLLGILDLLGSRTADPPDAGPADEPPPY